MQQNQPDPTKPTEQEATEYLLVLDSQSNALNQLSEVVNDWAGKKGWNDPQTSKEQVIINRVMAQVAIAHIGLSNIIELIRHGSPLSGSQQEILVRLLDEPLDIGDCCAEKLRSLLNSVTPDQCEDLAQCALFHTELSECAAAVVSQEQDDHCPSLSGVVAELGDVLIRIFHYCGKRALDLGNAVQVKHLYNIRRAYRHGKLK